MTDDLITKLRAITSAMIELSRELAEVIAKVHEGEGETEANAYALTSAERHIGSAIKCLDTVTPYDEATDEEQQH